MSTNVDPKNSRKRTSPNSGIISKMRGVLPGRWYLTEALYLGIFILVMGVLYDFAVFVQSHPQYEAKVTIQGLQKLDSQQVLNNLSTLNSQTSDKNLVNISVSQIQGELKREVPRFKSVEVRKQYPDKLMISVQEREPVALVARVSKDSNRVYLPVDEEGVVFRPTSEETRVLPRKVPLVKGLETDKPGTRAFVRKWNQVKLVLDAVNKKLSRDRVNWIEVRTGGYVELEINRPKKLKVRLGVGSYSEKLAKLQQMMQTEQFLNIKRYVNLTDLDNVRVL